MPVHVITSDVLPLAVDDTTAGGKAWSGTKINTELSSKATINDSATSASSVWSSQKTNTELSGKASTSHNHDGVYSPVAHTHTGVYSPVAHTHDDRYYTESESDALLAGKAPTSHTHAQTDVVGLASSLAGKSDTGHTHDDRYYTETETDTLLSGKAATTHAHAISDVTGLQTALDGKEAAFTVGTGLSLVSGTLSNSAPDQTVALTAGTNVSITGTYPNFTINSTASGLPTQTGNSGKYLTTDGTAASWSTISAEPTISSGTTSQYWRGDKSWQTLDKTAVGLSNVPNTDATNASNLASGTVPTGRLGSGTASSSTYLRGDGTWATPAGGSSAETQPTTGTSGSITAGDGAYQRLLIGTGGLASGSTVTIGAGSTTNHHLDLLIVQGSASNTLTFATTYVDFAGGIAPVLNSANGGKTLLQMRWDNTDSKWKHYNTVWY